MTTRQKGHVVVTGVAIAVLGFFLTAAPVLAVAVPQLVNPEIQIASIIAPQAQVTLDQAGFLSVANTSENCDNEGTTGIGLPAKSKDLTNSEQMASAIFLDGIGAMQSHHTKTYTGMSGAYSKAMDEDGWGQQTSFPTYSDVSSSGCSTSPVAGIALPPDIRAAVLTAFHPDVRWTLQV